MDTSQRASICRTSASDSAAYCRNCLIADAKAGQAAETTAAPGLQPGDRRPDIRGGILAPPTRTDEAHRGAFAPAQTARSSHSPDGRKWHNATKVDDAGQTLLEFALGLMIFLVLVFGTMDFASLLYHKVTLQNAARQAGRYAITGQCLLNSNGACSMSRYLSIQRVLEHASIGIINSSNIASDVTIICTNEGGGCPTSAGGPGDLVTITVTYKYSFMTAPIARLFPGGTYTIVVSSAFINEPFPPNES